MTIDVRQAINPEHGRAMDTSAMRESFLVSEVFVAGQMSFTYSHFDRILFGGVVPVTRSLSLEPSPVLATEFFLQRRELGMINIGGAGRVVADDVTYEIAPRDGLYIGMGTKEVSFSSDDPGEPAKFYCVSTTAHHAHPSVQIRFADAQPVHLGADEQSNKRTIYQYVHPKVLKSCQLAMGMTILEPRNVWNTMPTHTHDRRMEVYLYLRVPEDAVVFHLMGPPTETRHLVIRNEQAAISPNWSIHSGVGTTNYAFIWAMAGENQEFTDMDAVPMDSLK